MRRGQKDCVYSHGYNEPETANCPGCKDQLKYFWEKIMAHPKKSYPFETSMFNKKS